MMKGELVTVLLVELVSLLLIQLEMCSANVHHEASKIINEFRTKHHAPKMHLNHSLSVLAKKCAEFHMMENDGDRECPYKNGDGEIWLMGTDDWKKSDMAGKAAEKWYKQNENYDFTKPGYSPTTGAFTQLIWKSSEKLGFGFAQMKGKTVAVGIFSPGGNVKGMFPENVAAP